MVGANISGFCSFSRPSFYFSSQFPKYFVELRWFLCVCNFKNVFKNVFTTHKFGLLLIPCGTLQNVCRHGAGSPCCSQQHFPHQQQKTQSTDRKSVCVNNQTVNGNVCPHIYAPQSLPKRKPCTQRNDRKRACR